MQFYRVDRHYKVATELVRARLGALIPFDPLPLKGVATDLNTPPELQVEDLRALETWRPVLQPLLIRPELGPAFDAVARLLFSGKPLIVDPGDPGEPDIEVFPLEVSLKRGTAGTKQMGVVTISLRDTNGNALALASAGGATGILYDSPEMWEDLTQGGVWLPQSMMLVAPPFPVRSKLGSIVVSWDTYPGPQAKTLSVAGVKLTGLSPNGQVTLIDTDQDGPNSSLGEWGSPTIREFPIRPPRPARAESVRPADSTDDSRDAAAAAELIAHVHAFKDYYTLRIAQSGFVDFGAISHGTQQDQSVLAALSPEPIAYTEGSLVFPAEADFGDLTLTGEQAALPPPVIGHISLPSPGLLGEAQLGSCNACEERDVTRFWDWQESPCPDHAPDITGVHPGFYGQAPNVPTPTPLPSSVLQINAPPSVSTAKLWSPLVANSKSPLLGLISDVSWWCLPSLGLRACGRTRRR
jgi:hypothetical protein